MNPHEEREAFDKYYALVLRWNPRLHLTTITEPNAFAERHIAEALEVASYIAEGIDEFWDVGSGLGIPGIPVAVRRNDLRVRLIESNKRKAIFLEEAARELRLDNVTVINERFDVSAVPETACIAARAVENMGELVMSFFKARCRQVILLGGNSLLPSSIPGWQISRHPLPSGHGLLFDCKSP